MNKRAFIVISGTMFVSMLGMGIVTPFIPIYADQMGASALEVGLVQAGFSISMIFTLLFIGRMSDRFGRKVFLCIGLALLSIASLAFIWAENPAQLIITRLFQGLGASMHLPIAQSYLGDITPEGDEGKWMGYFNAVMFSGMGMGPLIGGVLTDVFSISTTFIVMAVLNIIGFVITLTLLREMARRKASREGELSVIAPMRSRVMRGVFTFRMTTGFGTSALMAFLPLFADRMLALSASLIGLLLAARTPVSILQSYTGRLADRYNRRLLVVFSGAVSMVFLLVLPWSTGFWTLLVFYMFVGIGQSLGMPASNAYVVEEGREYGMGACMTLFMLAMQIGNGIGPVLLGEIADIFGLVSVFYSAAGFLLLGVLIFILMVRKPSLNMLYNR